MQMETASVYIYTAVNGYSWQGCDGETADSLQKIVGNAAKAGAGGIRRGEVGGLNGTAIYRHHIRAGGDFADRDSHYIALVFLPFSKMGDRGADFTRLWDDKLLSEPIAKGDRLEGLTMDFELKGDMRGGAAVDGANSFWTTEKTFQERGGAGQVLARLGEVFQSSLTELGPLSARIEEDGKGGLLAEVSYKPFGIVAETVAARKAFEGFAGSDEEEKTKRLNAWRDCVERLNGFVDHDRGAFRHFLGFCEFANQEKDALNRNLGNEAERRKAEELLDRVSMALVGIGAGMAGNEAPMLDYLAKDLDEVGVIIARLTTDENLKNRHGDLANKLKKARSESVDIGGWLADVGEGGKVSPQIPEELSGKLLGTVKTIVRRLKDAEDEKKHLEDQIAQLKTEKGKLEDKCRMLDESAAEIKRAAANAPIPRAKSAENGYGRDYGRIETGGRRYDRLGTHRGNWKYVLIALAVIVLMAVAVYVVRPGGRDNWKIFRRKPAATKTMDRQTGRMNLESAESDAVPADAQEANGRRTDAKSWGIWRKSNTKGKGKGAVSSPKEGPSNSGGDDAAEAGDSMKKGAED